MNKEDNMSDQKTKKYEFKAEVKKLLDILVHSLYTSREIFLRELISNASDALDKIRFELNRGTDVSNKDIPLEIKVDFDEKKKILTVTDTGIGMTRDEVIANIGTIAKSGTEEFLKLVTEAKGDPSNIIGKFGIGFYSVFMVAKEVIIKTKSYKPDETAIEWKSDGLGDYEILELDDKKERGTQIEIHLKDDADEFVQKWKLESTIKKHSNFITFPIYLAKEKVNTVSAIWREPKSSIKKEQYDEFYKFLSFDNDPPMDVIHKAVDAPIQFNALLFIPKKSNDFFWYDRENYGLDLYVRRVLIQHKNKDLLPEYLSFVKGVVDSEDLPLNISRETLQENVIFTKIASSVTTTVLSSLQEKSKDSAAYNEFWKEHGKIFKLGYSDFVNHDKYVELVRFNSTASKDENELTSFAEYVSRLKDGQKEIYYMTGSSRDAINADPRMEIFRNKGLEVFLLIDPVDEFVIQAIRKYKDYEIKSVENIDLKKLKDLKDVEEKKHDFQPMDKTDEKHFSSLLSRMKSILGSLVEDVVESKRLIDSPACLVSKDDTVSAQMKKILKMAKQDSGQVEKRILEINPDHKLVRNLVKVFKSNSNDDFITSVTEQLYESALLQEGSLANPHKLIKRLNQMLEQSSSWYVDLNKLN